MYRKLSKNKLISITRIFEDFEVFIKCRVSLAEEEFLVFAVSRMIDNVIGSHFFCQFARKIPSVYIFVRHDSFVHDFF